MTFEEPTLYWGEILWLLSPELVLLVAGLLLMGLDMIRPRREEKGWLPYVALAGAAVALAATLTLGQHESALVLAALVVDPFALLVKVLAAVTLGMVTLSAVVYIQDHTRFQGEFYALLLFAGLAMMLMGAATNLILIFLAVDFLSLTSYVLTGFLREDRRSSEAAIKYFLYGAVLSAAMLYGMSLLYGATGSTDLADIAAGLTGEARFVVLPALVLMMAGLSFKVAAVPFHHWAPDAYEGAPTPVTAFLSVGPKVAGFAVLARVLLTALPDFQFDWGVLLAAISVMTMTLGNLVALWQRNMKRLLAYSSIAQAGYILIGLVVAGEGALGLSGVLFYLLSYLFTNLGAFAVIIGVSNATGSEMVEGYAGLVRRAPWLAGGLTIFFLSLTGVPPTAGFFAKFLVLAAAIKTGTYAWLAIAAVINGVISLFYYFNVVRHMFFLPAAEDATPIRHSRSLQWALMVALVLTLVIGVFPGPFIAVAQASAYLFGG